ncbi:glycoside hydrolase/deacetylase [Pluteus cervinus]|uniref:Glycoside hydrolase/deacetylase n=1 Tax=Pluteus cervinus TaxID=181527 RepID=A0ACD3AA84_9AGAR|nr:glycoside hydrolase/deacetylase [Pluteus cervinus]
MAVLARTMSVQERGNFPEKRMEGPEPRDLSTNGIKLRWLDEQGWDDGLLGWGYEVLAACRALAPQVALFGFGRRAALAGTDSTRCGTIFSVVRIDDPQIIDQEGNSRDPNGECAPYYYPQVANQIASFPTIWQPATILPSDTNAQSKWASIQPSVPNIPVKGSNGSSVDALGTYDHSDPDCWWSFQQCTHPKASGVPPDVSMAPEPNTLGYGFDDGPNCSHNAFYDYLQSQNQKATLFFIGSNTLDWPMEALRGLQDGHEICVLTSFASADAFAELYYTMQAIKLVTGVTPTCWRPPFGDVDDRIRAIANGLGLQTIMWQYDSNDWKAGTGNVTDADVDANYATLCSQAVSGNFASAGTIMLTHELNNFTMSEAVKFYPQLKQSFQHLVPVGVALNKSQPYVEPGYFLPNFTQYISGTTTIAPIPGLQPSTTASLPGTSPTGSSAPDTAKTSGGARVLNEVRGIVWILPVIASLSLWL